MNIIFIYRQSHIVSKRNPLISSQQESIQQNGNKVFSFNILGRSFYSYLSNSQQLRKVIKQHNIDIIHAHYSLSGFTAVLAFSSKPVVLSLMGSDILGEHITQNKISFRSKIVILITRFVQYFVDAIIVKSQNIYDQVSRKSITSIIPNGVDLQIFQPINKLESRNTLGLSLDKKYILFLANPSSAWKNFKLAAEAVGLLNDPDTILLAPYPVSHNEIPLYLNATDVFISTSFMEGSSNVIKEAMACNCPVVATDVGDASLILAETPGCFITGFEPAEVSQKLRSALIFAFEKNQTKGRERIIHLGLDAESVSKKIIKVYESVLVKASD